MNESVIEVFPKDEANSLVIISVFTIILAVSVNVLVLFGYVTSRSSRARPSSILLISLTFAQLLTSLVVIPSQLLQVIKPHLVANGGVFCVFLGTTFCSFYVTITETLACISVDRFLAVKSMLRYSTIITRKRVVAVVVFTWIHAFIFETVIGPFVLRIRYNNRVGACGIVFDDIVFLTIILAVYVIIPFGIIIVFNCKMAKHLWRHNRRVVQGAEGQSIDRKQIKNRGRQAQERKVTFMAFCINTTCFVCWIPIMVTSTMQTTSVYPTPFVNAFTTLILHMSLIINAGINLYVCGDLRNTIRRCCSRSVHSSEGVYSTDMIVNQ